MVDLELIEDWSRPYPDVLTIDALTLEYTLTDEVQEWCRSSINPGWHFSSITFWDDRFIGMTPTMSFENIEDMVAFRLRWL